MGLGAVSAQVYIESSGLERLMTKKGHFIDKSSRFLVFFKPNLIFFGSFWNRSWPLLLSHTSSGSAAINLGEFTETKTNWNSSLSSSCSKKV